MSDGIITTIGSAITTGERDTTGEQYHFARNVVRLKNLVFLILTYLNIDMNTNIFKYRDAV